MIFYRRRSDLPLSNDATSRFLPWLVALMVFLSAMAMAGALIVSDIVARWDKDVAGTLTVQIAPDNGPRADADLRMDKRVQEALAIIRATPGVETAVPIAKQQSLALLEPWLGGTELLQDLPLPRLIDVSVASGQRVDLGQLSSALRDKIPGITLDDHRVWLSRLIDLGRSFEALALGVLVMVSSVTIATVIYATRTGMAVHHSIVEVLHLIGAQDEYIARQFAERAYNLGLLGGLFGIALAIPILIGIDRLIGRTDGGFALQMSLPWLGWMAIAALPWLAGLLSMGTARLTVKHSLSKMP